MSEGRISITYLVNSDQFNQSIGQMKKNMQLCNQEIKNSAKEIDLYGSNIQTLTNKQKAIQQAIEQSKKIMSSYSDNIKKNKQALSDNTAELEKLAAKKKEANKAYKDAAKTYGEESDEVKKLKEALNDVSEEYNIMQSRIKGNEKAITTGTSQMEKQRGVLLDLQNELKKVSDELEKQGNKFIKASENFAKYGAKLESVGGKMKNLGSDVQKAGALIVGSAGTLATFAASFESSMAKVNSIAKYNTEDLKKMSDEIIDLSNETGQGAEDIAEAVYQAISASVDADKAVSFVETSNKLAVGGFTDVSKAVDVLTTVINAYGLNAEEASSISDKLIETQNLGKTTVDELAVSMGKIIPTAKAANVGVDQICTGYAELTASGIATAEATTYMNSMLNELSKSGTKTSDMLKNKMGKSFQELMDEGATLGDIMKILSDGANETGVNFTDLWSSQEAGKAALSMLSDEGEKFNDILKEMQNSSGATNDAFETIADTSEFKFKKSLNEMKNSAIKLGESLLPVLDDVSKGISDLAKFISKLNPETVTAAAKFGALALAFGTAIKATGSLVSVLGKGAQGISAILKIAGNTKALGSFSQALSESSTAAGGLFKSVGGLSKVFSGFTLTGGLIGGAIAGVAALGYAFYENQKEISDSEKKIAEMGDGIDDFTGRVRSNGNILEQVFGKELTWNISDDYKNRLEESKGKVEEWVQYIKGLQEEIQGILNSTEKTDYQKNSEVDELLGTGQKYTGVVNAELKAGYMTYMEDKGFSKDAVKSYVDAWEEAYAQDVENFNKNQDMIQALYESDMQNYGKLTQETEDKITKLKEENAELQANIESTKYEDLDALSEKHILQIQKEQEQINKNRSEGLNNQLQAEREAVKEKYALQREEVDNSVWASKEIRDNTMDNINKMEKAEMDRTTFNQQQNLLRAEYDRDYAYQHGLTVEDMITANSNWATVVRDSNGQIVSSYFSTADQMKNWANEMGYGYTQVEAANGQLVSVVLDANGNIIGSVDNLANKYNINCESINSALSNYQGTTSEKMAQIKRDLDSGIIKAEQYGMTSDEFYKVAQACFESGGDIKKLIDLLYQIPTERNVTVNAEVSDAIAKLNYLKQVAEDTGTKIAGVNSPGGAIPMDGYETGGTVNKSGIYLTNESGTELIDSFGTSTVSNYSLGETVKGEYAYLTKGTKISNALMTTQKMSQMVNSRVDARFANIDKRLDRLCTVLERAGINTSSNINVTMNNPNFTDQNSQKKKLNEMVTLIKGVKR